MTGRKQTQLKNHPDFKVDGKWIQKFNPEPYVVYTTRAGVLWTNMTQRCKAGGSLQKNFPTYALCQNGYEDFQHFAEWCQQQVGYMDKDDTGKFWQLDKDILLKGNKIYSPETCVFVPKALNCLLERSQKTRGEYPIGVYKRNSTFIARVLRGVLGMSLVSKSFDTPEKAFCFYKEQKELYIKQVADRYKGLVDDRVIEALYNYVVEIGD